MKINYEPNELKLKIEIWNLQEGLGLIEMERLSDTISWQAGNSMIMLVADAENLSVLTFSPLENKPSDKLAVRSWELLISLLQQEGLLQEVKDTTISDAVSVIDEKKKEEHSEGKVISNHQLADIESQKPQEQKQEIERSAIYCPKKGTEVFRSYAARWKAIKGMATRGHDYKAISDWLYNSNQYKHLACEWKTVKKTIAAGEAGLLDNDT